MISDYTIQPFSFDHFPLMEELFLSAFKTKIGFDSFIKKYDTRNLGHEVIGFLAIHTSTQEPAAFYGVFPLKVLINGEVVLAAQSGDTMTHKKHRKKGLFVHLAKITFEECVKKRIGLIFGQPNAYSKHGLINSLKFVHLDDVIRYDLKLKLKTFPLPKLLHKLGLSHIYYKYAKKVLRKRAVNHLKDFTNSVIDLPVKTLRNEAYLNYKNSDEKMFIEINETVIWIKFAEVLWIGDADDYEKMNASTISKLKKLAFVLGYNTISFHINKRISKPSFLSAFREYDTEASCFYYLNSNYQNYNMLITGADFDTW